jgi:hypothetical protein
MITVKGNWYKETNSVHNWTKVQERTYDVYLFLNTFIGIKS